MSIHGVADDALPAGLVVRGTTPLQARSPITNPFDLNTPRAKGSPLPAQLNSAQQLAIRAAVANQTSKHAIMSDMLRILQDPTKVMPAATATKPATVADAQGKLIVTIARMLVPPAAEDGEVASLVDVESTDTMIKPTPAPAPALNERHIETLQQSFPASTRRLQRSSTSAFSESSHSTVQQQ